MQLKETIFLHMTAFSIEFCAYQVMVLPALMAHCNSLVLQQFNDN